MSYDLELFRVPDGEDPLQILEEVSEHGLGEINSGPPDPEKEAAKLELAKQLQVIDPRLEVFPFDYQAIAKTSKISDEEARTRYRHIELNVIEIGIQITLFDDTASLTIPYWHRGEKAREVWREAWRCLECLERDGGFRVYDPQLDRMLNLVSDLEEVCSGYDSGVDFSERAVEESTTPTKPWWKFW